jgi:hydrogenase/urease accessory protein HupE
VKYLVSFGRFWWNFVVGDDWQAAALVIVAIGVTAAVAASDIAAWWVMPLAVVVVLALSLRRATSAS